MAAIQLDVLGIYGTNWRAGTGYPTPEASLKRIAWEFLRRNPEYLSAWAAYRDKLNYIAKRKPELGDAARHLLNTLPAGEWRVSLNEDAMEASALADGDDGTPLYVELAKPFGISHLIAPNTSGRLFSLSFTRVAALAQVSAIKPNTSDRSSADETDSRVTAQVSAIKPDTSDEYFFGPIRYLRVDLRRPVGALTEAFADFVRREQWANEYRGGRWQVMSQRPRRDVYALYLRILDADLERAPNGDIRRALFPDLPARAASKKLGDARRAAEQMRDFGYQQLPFMEHVRVPIAGNAGNRRLPLNPNY
jgi:hypothetical protein